MAAPSNASACGRSRVWIAGSNPARGEDVCLVECYVGGGFTRPEESYQVCVIVCEHMQQ